MAHPAVQARPREVRRMHRSLRCSRSPDWWVTALRVATPKLMCCAEAVQRKDRRRAGQRQCKERKGKKAGAVKGKERLSVAAP